MGEARRRASAPSALMAAHELDGAVIDAARSLDGEQGGLPAGLGPSEGGLSRRRQGGAS